MITQIGTLAVLASLTLFLLGLAFTVGIDPYIRREHRRILLIIAALCMTLIAQNYWDFALTVGPPRQTLRTVVSIYGYCVTLARWFAPSASGLISGTFITAVPSLAPASLPA